jgi:hypothetical protein
MVPPSSSLHVAAGTAFFEHVISALEVQPARVPVVLGGCGSGRTTVLRHLQRHYGEGACQYIDVERTATTPERFLRAIVACSPFVAAGIERQPSAPRDAFDLTLAFLATARTSEGRPAMFLLDEALELRTFESFPGLRRAVRELLNCLATTRNRFVLASRYQARAARLLQGSSQHFVSVPAPGLTAGEIADLLRAPAAHGGPAAGVGPDEADVNELADAVRLLSDGRPAYADAIAATMHAMRVNGGCDPVSALAALLSPGGRLASRCEHSYELRLHRARGYGALKAILDVLAESEPLTLTEISLRLHRTPGSTKDYLSWLEDVDLVRSDAKRYHVQDPILRLWVRLYCHPVPPGDEVVAREVQRYALQRLAAGPPARASRASEPPGSL